MVAGKYQVLSIIGQGAMGIVYRARQIALDKIVALKVLSRDLRDDPEFVLRFHNEARAASRLDHPHSARVLDFGEDPDGLLYIAMELLAGRTLSELIEAEFPLQPARTAVILTQALSAVGAAHKLKILHRDLKPENIVILEGRDDEDRRIDVVKVCDFGIAKLESDAPETRSARTDERPAPKATMAGIILGTPQYMSPEQARAAPLDVRSDLYSLGVVLFEMLTKRAPFDGVTPAEVLRKHVFDAPPAPSSLQPGVDPTLEAVCLKALQKDPGDRFASARDMRVALRGLVDQAQVELAPAAPRPRAFDTSAPTISAEPVAVAPARKRPPRSVVWLLALAAACVAAATWRFLPARHATPQVSGTAARATSSAPPVRIAATSPPSATAQIPAVDPPTRVRGATARVAVAVPASAASAAEQTPSVPDAVVTTAPPPTLATAATTTAATAHVGVAPHGANDTPRPDPNNARVVVGAIRADRVDPASVTSALRHVDFTGCYRDAVRAGSDADGDATLALDMDEEHVTRADVVGGRFPASLRQCISQRVQSLRVPSVDTGDASAKVTLRFVAR